MGRLSLSEARQRAVEEASQRYRERTGLRIRERGTWLEPVAGILCYRVTLSAQYQETFGAFDTQEDPLGTVVDVLIRVTYTTISLTLDVCVETGEVIGLRESGWVPSTGPGQVPPLSVVAAHPVPCPRCGQQAIAKVWSGGTVEMECLSCGKSD